MRIEGWFQNLLDPHVKLLNFTAEMSKKKSTLF